MGRADLHHLDTGSTQGRRARAVCELRHWIEVLWREVDDLVDNDSPNSNGELSEGFPDYKGTLGSQDLDFDADIRVSTDGGPKSTLTQRDGGLVAFLRELEVEGAVSTNVSLRIEGEVYKEALKKWTKAVSAVCKELQEASSSLTQASRESAFIASTGSGSAYRRDLGLVEVRFPVGVEQVKVTVSCPNGEVIVGGSAHAGSCTLEFDGTTTMVLVTGWYAGSTLLGISYREGVEYQVEADCGVPLWYELEFGAAVLDHRKG
jgi:hypothetical protein